MKVERITYRRVKNLGNYENETLELSAILDDEDEQNDVAIGRQIQMLKQRVCRGLDLIKDNQEIEF
ncbi:hypothetical protein STA3757_03950 [Stanieria sp. NIES-3757]|nr:hypothetical protein STA3757_03950 [Stanieria sp. NIES-3757]